jgi:DNA-directed RNA polymerase sigma subunit (sigma70/sigma32)
VSLLNQLIEAIPSLYEREQKIFKMRLGLNDDGNPPLTQDEVAFHFNLCSGRIMQIENEVLRRLGIYRKGFKRPGRLRHYLKDYLKDMEAFETEKTNDP